MKLVELHFTKCVALKLQKGFFKRKKLAEEDEALRHGDPEDE